ncbi:hypothetical protein FF098_005520 [Parvularcula flava]|uniref:DUF2007 domain-containing protein n=1 Tax=Aquisalinus luteolus TaxID=1566827 RepID=A0A8J3EQT6_9PROT|nr:hypothetical protein [Aquisalinus luteolus]NHK27357.1 hypothetical protein [Aquisalinus luteolus]GGH95189.1 hypothetical protein GCM10011355_11140 [Aquisalinus luteolus]
MQTLAKYLNQEEARIALSYLRANDVDAELADANAYSAAYPNLAMGATMLRIMVPKHQFEAAQTLLKTVSSGEAEFDGEDYDDEFYGEPEDGEQPGKGIFIRYKWLMLALLALAFVFLYVL